jgi:hypothetical protein
MCIGRRYQGKGREEEERWIGDGEYKGCERRKGG